MPNLGEIIRDGASAKLEATTELQEFALIVTAEPYFTVSRPGDVVALENIVRRDTNGGVEPVEGFAKRVGIVTANYGVQTVMEAGLGNIWGEDPRYQRTEGAAFSGRLGHVVKMTFFARNGAGNEVPAYARLMAILGSNFLANTWMADSQVNVSDALVRTDLGFLSRMGENAYKEFRSRK